MQRSIVSTRAIVVAAVLSCAAFGLAGACSSEATTADAGGQGGAGGDSTGVGGAGVGGAGGNACASAVVNGACSSPGQVCSSGCTDPCSFCTGLMCSGGHWNQMESFPAQCFSCGPTARCLINTQTCQEVEGGPAGSSPSYRCLSTPQQCLPTPTCACVAPSSDLCTTSGTGQVTTVLLAP